MFGRNKEVKKEIKELAASMPFFPADQNEYDKPAKITLSKDQLRRNAESSIQPAIDFYERTMERKLEKRPEIHIFPQKKHLHSLGYWFVLRRGRIYVSDEGAQDSANRGLSEIASHEFYHFLRGNGIGPDQISLSKEMRLELKEFKSKLDGWLHPFRSSPEHPYEMESFASFVAGHVLGEGGAMIFSILSRIDSKIGVDKTRLVVCSALSDEVNPQRLIEIYETMAKVKKKPYEEHDLLDAYFLELLSGGNRNGRVHEIGYDLAYLLVLQSEDPKELVKNMLKDSSRNSSDTVFKLIQAIKKDYAGDRILLIRLRELRRSDETILEICDREERA